MSRIFKACQEKKEMHVVTTSTIGNCREHTWRIWWTTSNKGLWDICMFACFTFCGVCFCIALQLLDYRFTMLAQGLYYMKLIGNFWNFMTFLPFCTVIPVHTICWQQFLYMCLIINLYPEKHHAIHFTLFSMNQLFQVCWNQSLVIHSDLKT